MGKVSSLETAFHISGLTGVDGLLKMFMLPVCGIAVLTLDLDFRCLSWKRIEVAVALSLTASLLMSVPEGVRRGERAWLVVWGQLSSAPGY